MTPFPCLSFLCSFLVLSHLPQFWLALDGLNSDGDEPRGERKREREMIPEACCCSQDHREEGAGEEGVGLAHLGGATQRNSLGLCLCRVSSQLPRFPKSRCWDTSITASYSFEEGGCKLSALRQVTLSNQIVRPKIWAFVPRRKNCATQ